MSEAPAPRGARLSRAQAVAAAIDIILRDGVESLSMRRLGAELGVDPMAVYHYVPSKEALYDALVAAIWDELELPDGDGAWEQELRGLAHGVRDLLTRYANALPILATRSSLGAGSLGALDHGIAVLRRAGLPPRQALALLSVATSWLIGHALAEAGRPPAGVGDVPEDAVLAAMSGSEAEQAHPELAAAVAAGGGLLDWDEVFEQGLDTLIRGVRARVES